MFLRTWLLEDCGAIEHSLTPVTPYVVWVVISRRPTSRAYVKLFELGVLTPEGLFLGVSIFGRG